MAPARFLIFMDKTFYNQYIKGPRWAAKREAWFNAFGKYCRACGTAYGPIQLHHMTYDRLGRERMSDLVALCANCHKEVEITLPPGGWDGPNGRYSNFVKAKRKNRGRK
jgi:5-methylcytosine-specific restriction endonuclease McrA